MMAQRDPRLARELLRTTRSQETDAGSRRGDGSPTAPSN